MRTKSSRNPSLRNSAANINSNRTKPSFRQKTDMAPDTKTGTGTSTRTTRDTKLRKQQTIPEQRQLVPQREEQGQSVTVRNDFDNYVDSVKKRSTMQIKNFEAGRMKQCIHEWRKLTSDPSVLEIIRGHKIGFTSEPVQEREPQQIRFSKI